MFDTKLGYGHARLSTFCTKEKYTRYLFTLLGLDTMIHYYYYYYMQQTVFMGLQKIDFIL